MGKQSAKINKYNIHRRHDKRDQMSDDKERHKVDKGTMKYDE